MDERDQARADLGRRGLEPGDIVTIKGSLMDYTGRGTYIPAGTAAVVQTYEDENGLVWFVCPELREKKRFLLPADCLEFVRTRDYSVSRVVLGE